MVTPALRAETRQEKLRWWKAASAEGSMPKACPGGGRGAQPAVLQRCGGRGPVWGWGDGGGVRPGGSEPHPRPRGFNQENVIN